MWEFSWTFVLLTVAFILVVAVLGMYAYNYYELLQQYMVLENQYRDLELNHFLASETHQRPPPPPPSPSCKEVCVSKMDLISVSDGGVDEDDEDDDYDPSFSFPEEDQPPEKGEEEDEEEIDEEEDDHLIAMQPNDTYPQYHMHMFVVAPPRIPEVKEEPVFAEEQEVRVIELEEEQEQEEQPSTLQVVEMELCEEDEDEEAIQPIKQRLYSKTFIRKANLSQLKDAVLKQQLASEEDVHKMKKSELQKLLLDKTDDHEDNTVTAVGDDE